MAVLTEGRHAAGFILSEASGQRSRENGTVLAGRTLKAGQLVQLSGTKFVAFTGLHNTAGDALTQTKGILLYDVDASAGDAKASYIARDAEVNSKILVYPTESTAGGEKVAAIRSLALLGIIVRD